MRHAKSIFAFLLISGLCGSLNIALAQQYGWMKVADPTDLQATAIEFADRLNGWIGIINANFGKGILHTSDGGETWQAQTAPLDINVSSISFINSLQGWVVGNYANANGVIIHTGNAGQTWVKQFEVGRRYYEGVSAQSPLKATTMGFMRNAPYGGVIVRTSDAGQHWRERSFLTQLSKVAFADSLHGWALAREGDTSRVIHTVDGGVTWTIQRYDTYDIIGLKSISFADSLHGWAIAAADNPWVIRTSDGGVTWEKVYKFPSSQPNPTFFNKICFVDTLNGWLLGGIWLPGFHPAIYGTFDGGRSWALDFVDTETPDLFGAVDGVVLDQHHAWAIAGIGAVYKYGLITAISDHDPVRPSTFVFLQNYPNPFNTTTTITYSLPKRAQVRLLVYDTMGRVIRTLVSGVQGPGDYRMNFDGADLPTGVYYCTLKSEHFEETKAMLLIK